MDEDIKQAAYMRWFGASRAEVARKLDVPESQVRSWEKGQHWAAAMAHAANKGNDKLLTQARRVTSKILRDALDPEAPVQIVKEAAAISRWYIAARDPDFQAGVAAGEGAAAAAKAKVLETMKSLSVDELRALTNEQTIFGFPTEGVGETSTVSAEFAFVSDGGEP